MSRLVEERSSSACLRSRSVRPPDSTITAPGGPPPSPMKSAATLQGAEARNAP